MKYDSKTISVPTPAVASMGEHIHVKNEPMLILKDARLGYEKNIVLDHLNFTVNVGDYICIIGENGSGKSTLVKSMLGLIKPLGGSVSICACVERGSIGYLPQQTKAQKNFPTTVNEVVLSGFLNRCGFRPFYTKKEKEEAGKNMEKLGIAALADRCYRDLSGGQQQRVLLARALCSANKLLILDEPVTGLDPVAAEDLYAILRKINTEDSIAVVMVTHDMHNALREAKKILYIAEEHYYFGTTESFLASKDGERFARDTDRGASSARRVRAYTNREKNRAYDASYRGSNQTESGEGSKK